MSDIVHIQTDDFDVSELQAGLTSTESGAIVSFTGLVRSKPDVSVTAMSIEHYPGMTESSIGQIIKQARTRWEILQVTVIHRTGRLQAGEQIVYVGVASHHRQQAFEACAFIMDYLKTEAPFWKKEHRPDGDHWVESRESDQAALERWQR